MKKEYLEEYAQKEHEEFRRLIWKKLQNDTFSFELEKYPPSERFKNLQKPVALTSDAAAENRGMWSQIPFCGSLILALPPFSASEFESKYFRIPEIPRVIDFVKEEGRLQVGLSAEASAYEGLDYLDPFFLELEPPELKNMPLNALGNMKEIKSAQVTFDTISKLGFYSFLSNLSNDYQSTVESPKPVLVFRVLVEALSGAFVYLKIRRYQIVEEIEILIVDSPQEAMALLSACIHFIVEPSVSLRADLHNFAAFDVRLSRYFPNRYRSQKMRFPTEIGKILFKKLIRASPSLDACKEIIYHYDRYDLQKVQESLNQGIISHDPSRIVEDTEELSTIIDNIWNDSTIPKRVTRLRVGIPLIMAAVGSVAAGPIGTAGGLLAGLGYNVLDKSVDLETEGLSERLAKRTAKSYQANIYDFKRKYTHMLISNPPTRKTSGNQSVSWQE